MAPTSPVDRWGTLVGVGVGGYSAVRLVQQLRHRAIHPDMDDPGNRYLRWSPWIPAILLAVVAAAAIALFIGLGPIAILPVAICVAVAIVLWAIASASLWLMADRQRRSVRYAICEADYTDAPRQIKLTMRRIYRSAGSLKAGQAYQRDMFGDLGLDHAVYSAAERAIHSAELATAIRDLRPDAVPSDRILLEDARAQIRAITQELSAVEATLKRGAKAADKLSERIVEPERQRAAETARETAAAAAKERRDQACSRLEEVCARADTALGVQHDGVEERIVAVAAGYDEARQISDKALGNATQVVPSAGNATRDSHESAHDVALRAAKFTAGRAAKWSTAAAKASAQKLKNLDDSRSSE